MKKIVLYLFFVLCLFSHAAHYEAGMFGKEEVKNPMKNWEGMSEGNDNFSGSEMRKEYNNYQEAIKKINPETINQMEAEYEIAEKNGDQKKMALIEKDVKNMLGPILEVLKDSYDFSKVYERFTNLIRHIPERLKDMAVYLLNVLTALEILLMLIERPTEFPIGNILTILIKYSFLKYFISQWLYFLIKFKYMIIKIAATANGVNSITLSPSGIWDFYSPPLVLSYEELGIWDAFSGKALAWILALIPGLIIVGLLTLDLFMAELEYHLIVGMSVILFPFLMLKQTQQVGRGAITAVMTQLARLLVMYFFVSIGMSIIVHPKLLNFRKLGSFLLLFKYTIIVYLIRKFVDKSQSVAAALMGGGGGFMSGKEVGGMISSAIGNTISTVASVIGLAVGVKAMASTNSIKELVNTMGNAANMNKKGKEKDNE